jgi:hypothetical protein
MVTTQPPSSARDYWLAMLPPTLDAPTYNGALATAGVCFHFIAADPDLLEQFARHIEACPGALNAETILAYLALSHELLNPGCPEEFGAPLPNPHRHTHDD